MSDPIASHSEEITTTPTPPQVDETKQAVQDALAMFNLLPEEEPKKEEPKQEAQKEPEPPIVQEPERKGITVKYNKEEVFIDEDKIPEYARKGLNYDKIEGRAKELQAALDRAAKLNGFKDHADYLANLDRLEQEAKQREQDQFKELRQQLRQEAENAGLDPEKVEAWLDNHPLLKQAQTALQERERAEQERAEQAQKEKFAAQWNELYTAFPELVESSKAFERGEVPDWYTEEMQTMVASGYHPLHAYKLAHMDKLQEQARKQAEQKAIKEQRLGMRAQVETDAGGELEPEVPAELATAFSLFGLDPKAAKKYVKK